MAVRSPVRMARERPSSSQSEESATMSSPSLWCQKISTSGSSSSKGAPEPLDAAEHAALAREQAGVRGALGGDELRR
jgi:hypothetical protein